MLELCNFAWLFFGSLRKILNRDTIGGIMGNGVIFLSKKLPKIVFFYKIIVMNIDFSSFLESPQMTKIYSKSKM